MSKNFRRFIAVAAALALTATASMSVLAETETEGKHFSIVEAASKEDSLSITEIAAKCRPSVVAIETKTKVVYNNGGDDFYNNPFGMFGYGYGYGYGFGNGGRGGTQEYTQTAAGSGIILSEDGYILTNNHVISGADEITVYVQGADENAEETTYTATLVGASESNDIAVLKIDAEGLTPITFGDSDSLEIGELAVAIGNPMGTVHGSVTAGIVSATEHEVTIDDTTINAIQTDAAINPGNSGGALLDSYGNLIGVVYAKANSSTYDGIGYAIPVNTVKTLVDQLINHPEEVEAQTKGSQIMLGITIQDVTEAMSEQYNIPVGVYVREVSEMSAAERAGLQKGDIITEFAGKTVKTSDDLNAIKAEQKSGDVVSMKIDRNGHTMDLEIVMPQPTEAASN